MGENPLWSPDDQTSRLAELTAGTTDPLKELPLRRDVRSLGKLLGRVIVEQANNKGIGCGSQRLTLQQSL